MAENPSHGQYGVASCTTLVGSKKQMAQADSVYPTVFFINPSFVSMGQSSKTATNLRTFPLATHSDHVLVFLPSMSL